MKLFIFGSLSLLLLFAATTPAVQAQRITPGTPSNPAANPAADPGSRLTPGTPGAPSTSDHTNLPETSEVNPKNLMLEEPSASPITTGRGTLGTPSNPAANPAADPGSRLAPGTPGAPTTKQQMPYKGI